MRFKLLISIWVAVLLYNPGAAFGQSAPVPTGTATGNWRLVGPKEPMQEQQGGDVGRINTFVFHPTQPQTIYAATPAGGLWRTEDNGANWSLLSNLPGYGIQDIAIDSITPDTLYVLTGDGDGSQGAAASYGLAPSSIGVLKSIDGGEHWQPTGLSFDVAARVYGYRLIIDPANPAILVAATTQGLWRTTDGGQSWSHITAGITADDQKGIFYDVEFHPTDPSIAYAASMTVVYRSTDSGQTWTALSGGLPSASEICPAGAQCSIFNRVRLAVTPASPDTLYVLYGVEGGFGVGLYRSDDRGGTFTKRSSSAPLPRGPNVNPSINLTNPNLFGYVDNDFQGFPSYSTAIAVSPTNADIVHVGAVDIWLSKDGGKTWTRATHWDKEGATNYAHADVHLLAYRGDSLYAATDGGIYSSADGGTTWASITRMETGITIAQIYGACFSPQQPDVIYYGAQDNGTYRLTMDGDTFKVGEGDGYLCQVDPQNPNVLYLDSDQQILRTYDAMHAPAGLKNISPTSGNTYVRLPWVTPFILGPANHNSMYLCAADLWYSPDNGDHWVNLTNGAFGPSPECRQVAISPADPKTIYVAKEAEFDRVHPWGTGDPRTPLFGGGGVFRSTDGGATWQSITGTLPLDQAAVTNVAVSPTDARRVWVTFEGYSANAKVFVTTDGGATWTNLSSGLPNIPAHAVAADSGPANAVYVGMDDGVYYRDDQLGSWVPFKDGLPNDTNGLPIVVTSLLIQGAQHRMIATTFSRGVWVSDLHAP
jgi:photosystem II stability/assembly factor-like uncharacterized protein